MVSCVFLYLTFFMNILFAGRLNSTEKLAGVGLGTTVINVLGQEILIGMNGALETLVANAYGAG